MPHQGRDGPDTARSPAAAGDIEPDGWHLTELDDGAQELAYPGSAPVEAGFFAWEIDDGRVDCDPGVYQLHGIPAEGHSTMDAFLARVPPEELQGVSESMQRMTRACGSYQIRYHVRNSADHLRSMEARGRVLPGPDGRPARMVGVVMDTTTIELERDAAQRRLLRLARQSQRMQELTAALAAADNVEKVLSAAGTGFHSLGADAVAVVELDDGQRRVGHCEGFAGEEVTALESLGAGPGTALATCLAERVPVFLGDPEQAVELDPDLVAAFAASRFRAWAVLPLTVASERAAACLLGFPVCRRFTTAERTLLVASGGLFAQSLERARRHEAEHKLATTLQRGMLPARLPRVAGITLASRYQPASSGMEIGGDWYDAIPRPDGDLAVVIGDVMGHGADAASLMGRLRTAVHAYASEGHQPTTVLDLTNRLLADLNQEQDESIFATCCYAVISPSQRTVTLCRAGHPAPALLIPGRPPEVVDVDGGLPLGIATSLPYPATTVDLPAGSVLALTTDGALESADRDVRSGIASFLAELGRTGFDDLDELAGRLVEQARPDARHADDIAVLLARLDAE